MIARDIMKDLREVVECPPPVAAKADLQADLARLLQFATPATVKESLPVAGVEAPPERRAALRPMLDELAAGQPDRLPWPADWLGHCDSGEAAACRRLWADVLRRALGDICREVISNPTIRPRRDGGLTAGLAWIGGKEFRIVATLAGFDPAAIFERVRPMLGSAETALILYGRLFQPVRGVADDVA